MNTSNIKTVTVGIPAYYAEENIGNLLKSLIKQKENNYILEKVIVYYDCSGDKTIKKAKEIKSKKIEVIDGKIRKGFANGVKTLLSINKSDILLLLNDDIKIIDKEFLSKLVQPFLSEKNVGLVCGNPQPLTPKTFIDKALASRLKASEQLSSKVKAGNNVFSCDGKILTFSKAFINKLKLPASDTKLGNVDAYLYFACITSGLKFRFVKDAYVYYRNPTTWSDYSKWISRNNSQKYILMSTFGKELVNKEYTKPKLYFLQTSLLQSLKNPIGSIFILSTEILNVVIAKRRLKNLSGMWDVVKTTKNLNTL